MHVLIPFDLGPRVMWWAIYWVVVGKQLLGRNLATYISLCTVERELSRGNWKAVPAKFFFSVLSSSATHTEESKSRFWCNKKTEVFLTMITGLLNFLEMWVSFMESLSWRLRLDINLSYTILPNSGPPAFFSFLSLILSLKVSDQWKSKE